VVLGFDGSYSGDATAIVAVQIRDMPHLDVVRLWEDVGGQVPIIDVEDALRIACKRWRVQAIVAEPFRWAGDPASTPAVHLSGRRRVGPFC
jgi:hypothetical protein